MNTRISRSRMLALCLVAGCALLALVINWEIGSSQDPGRFDRARLNDDANGTPDLPSGEFEFPPLDAFAEFIERPLFSKTRRPYEPPVDAKDKPQPKAVPAPDWVLVGTVITPEKPSALLWDKRHKQFVTLEPGMDSGGWQLVEVAPAVVILERGAARHQIELPPY